MPQTKTTRVSIAPENLPYLEALAQQWGVDNLSKVLNYLLFDLKRQGQCLTTQTAATMPYVQIPLTEMFTEPVPQPQNEPEDEVINRFLALGLDTF